MNPKWNIQRLTWCSTYTYIYICVIYLEHSYVCSVLHRVFHVHSIHCSHSKYPREQETLIHFHGQTPDQFICHCGWYRLNFTLRNEMQQEIMGSHVSPDLWISTEKKKQDQQNSSTHFVRWSSAEKKKSAEIGPNIESAEVHYTKQKMSSAQAMVWILSSAEIFFSKSQVHNLCSGVPPKTKSH